MRVRVGGGDVCPCEYPRMKEKADTHISRKQLINYHGSVASLSPGSLLAGSRVLKLTGQINHWNNTEKLGLL